MSAPVNVYPIADNAAIPDWTFSGAASGWDCVNEVSSDSDTTYISRDGLIAHTGTAAFKMDAIVDPGTDIGFTVHVTARRSAGAAGAVTIDVGIYQGDPMAGGTLLEAKTVPFSASSYVEATAVYAAASIANVTDFTDIWIRCTFLTGLSRTYRVTQFYLAVPGTPSGHINCMMPLTGGGE